MTVPRRHLLRCAAMTRTSRSPPSPSSSARRRWRRSRCRPDLHGADKLAALVQRVSQVQASMTTLDGGLRAAPDQPPARRAERVARPLLLRGAGQRALGVHLAAADDGPDRGRRRDHLPPGREARRAHRGRAGAAARCSASCPPPSRSTSCMQYFSFTFRDPARAGQLHPGAQARPRTRSRSACSRSSIEIDRHDVPAGPRRLHRARRRQHRVLVLRRSRSTSRSAADLFSLTLPPDVQVVEIKLGSGE